MKSIIKYLSVIVFSAVCASGVYAQNSPAAQPDNEKTFGSKGTLEISGAFGGGVYSVPSFATISFDLYIGATYYIADNFHLGLDPNFSLSYYTPPSSLNGYFKPSVTFGYLIPLSKQLFLDLALDTSMQFTGDPFKSTGELTNLTPRLVLALKQDLGGFMVNYSFIQSYYTFGRDPYSAGSQKVWYDYYQFQLTIGLSFYF